ncbi:MAG: transporter [Chromatiales bacterium 21-64-14]|nr:MAG: transporter [Chromatiales bacterium 21-64-14]HQU15953.1 efflux RND transporter permease subunit [Gammaproteobacteria bacterium]
MGFAEWARHHRRSILFLILILAVGGAVSAFKLPVALFPHVNFPRIMVLIDAGDRPAEQMVIQVTQPVELAVRGVPGVRSLRSTTSRGSAELNVNFDWGHDMPMAKQQVASAINQILPNLPPGTRFNVRRMNPTVDPVAAYSLTSKSLDLVQLHDIARYELLPLLSTIRGVARIGIQGGQRAEYRVSVDPARLQGYGLSMDDVVKALSASNVLRAVGRLEDHYKLYLVLSDTRFTSLDQIRHTVLRSGSNGLVELEDIATVSRSTVPQWVRVTADGHNAVLVNIYQQPGGNTVRIVHDIRAKLAAYRSKLPVGVTIHNWYDQSILIVNSATSVRDAILIGAALAAVVLFVFLRNARITLIAIIVVPAVLAATVLLLYVLGMSFNIMTLGGMAAAVGLIIDDAIVMVEHIIRRWRGAEGALHERLKRAVLEFSRPLAGSSASTIIIFIPLAFLSGVTGAFFKALSLTMGSALLISFLVAWLAVPLLAEHLLRDRDAEQPEGGAFKHAIDRHYRRVLEASFARPWLVLIGLGPLLLAGYVCYGHVGSGFLPHMDEGGFVLDYRAPPGTSLTETDRLLRQVGAILQHNRWVDTYSRRTGLQLGGGVTEANEGDFFVRLKPPPRPNIEVVMEQVRQQVLAKVPGLHIEMAQLMEDLIGDLTAVPQPIEIKLFGDNAEKLLDTAPKIARAIAKIPGVVDVSKGIVLAGDALDIRVDRRKAALEGVDPEAITQQLEAYLTGVVTTHVQKGIKMIGIRVWVPKDMRTTEQQVGNLWLRAADGHLFPLRRVATIHTVVGQPQITRENLKRMVAVTGRISGRDMGSTIRAVKKVLNSAGAIPKGVYYQLGGLYKQQQIAFRGLMAVFVAAVALIFLLLLFLYERFQIALSILMMPLLAIAAVFIGLWITGSELNISSMMGMTMVVGIVTEVAIFYFSEYQEQIVGQEENEALVLAGIHRRRPIAMTTLAAILALLPLALALGQGSAMQQPLAIAIISGLVVQMPLVLLVMPVLFRLFPRPRLAPD